MSEVLIRLVLFQLHMMKIVIKKTLVLNAECLFLPQASEPHQQSESWTIHPQQLVLAAPTISE